MPCCCLFPVFELIADHSAVNIGLPRVGSASEHTDGKGVTIHQIHNLEEGFFEGLADSGE